MSVSVAPPAELHALPDDILRAIAEFVPPSGLLVLVQCNQRLANVLHDELSCRLDDLFVVNPYPPDIAFVWMSMLFCPLFTPSFDDVRTLFGEQNAVGGCSFVENPKGYDGPFGPHITLSRRRRRIHMITHGPADMTYVVKGSGPLHRFSSWLQRQHEELLAARNELP
jgi:hypothetical protein